MLRAVTLSRHLQVVYLPPLTSRGVEVGVKRPRQRGGVTRVASPPSLHAYLTDPPPAPHFLPFPLEEKKREIFCFTQPKATPRTGPAPPPLLEMSSTPARRVGEAAESSRAQPDDALGCRQLRPSPRVVAAAVCVAPSSLGLRAKLLPLTHTAYLTLPFPCHLDTEILRSGRRLLPRGRRIAAISLAVLGIGEVQEGCVCVNDLR